MKTLKIYSVIATLIIIAFSFWIYSLKKELKETEEVLQQCSERYYEAIGK
jgi:hypothetical protein